MTPKEEASYIFDVFKTKIEQSDFHVPEYISGVKHESKHYENVLYQETCSLAYENSKACVNEILQALCDLKGYIKNVVAISQIDLAIDYWIKVKKEL